MAKDIKPLLASSHEYFINKFFNKWIKNYYEISNIGIFVILNDDEMIYLSTHKQLAEFYVAQNFKRFDLILKKEIYLNYNLYPWKMNKTNKYINEINFTREKLFSMYSGTSFVRKLTDKNNNQYHVIFCVSTYNPDPMIQYLYACLPNEILEVCDFAYNAFVPLFQQFTTVELPTIDKFVPYEPTEQDILRNYRLKEIPIDDIQGYIQKLKIKSLGSYQNVMRINNAIEQLKIIK
jgi:hypothetical protein